MFSRLFFVGALAAAALAGCSKSRADNAPADNTGRNQRSDRMTPTADKAVDRPSDLDITQKVRKAVMDDGSLSTNAHNCKIVVQDGKVSLAGPVASAAESTRIAQIAAGIVGDANVTNQLEVTH